MATRKSVRDEVHRLVYSAPSLILGGKNIDAALAETRYSWGSIVKVEDRVRWRVLGTYDAALALLEQQLNWRVGGSRGEQALVDSFE